jgi:ABC-type nitrate/sulfonate/bicarbonate transport systems, periplasmic components
MWAPDRKYHAHTVFPKEEVMFARRSVSIVAVAAAAALLAGCAGGPAGTEAEPGGEERVKITVATQPDFFGVPLYFAVQKGFLEAEGLDAELQEFPTGVEGTEAVATGLADFTTVAGFPVASLAAKGAAVRIIGHNANSYQWWGFVTDGSISKPEDLYGKTVGLQSNSTAEYWFNRFVEFHNLDASQIKVLDAKYAQLVPAFAQSEVDAIIHFEPNVFKAVDSRPGSKVAWWGGDDNLLPFYGYVAAGPKIYKNEKVGKAVLRGLAAASAYMKSNQAEVIEFIRNLTGVTEESEIRKILSQIDFSVAFDAVSVEQIQIIADYQLERGNISSPVKAEDIVITDWVGTMAK